MKEQKNAIERVVLVVIIGVAAIVIVLPFFIAQGVYNTHLFTWIPGKGDVWMGFWASYSGTVTTLIVAVCTWVNGKAISNLQSKYYQLSAIVNMRLVKVSVVPIIEPDNLNRYQMVFCFHNMAQSLIEEIRLVDSRPKSNISNQVDTPENAHIDIKVGEQQESLTIVNQYFGLQDENAVLQFEINLDGKTIKRDFIKSYFYYSQFPMEKNDIKLDVVLQVRICEQDDAKGKPEDWMRRLHVELFPEPEFDKAGVFMEISDRDTYMDPFKIKIKTYTWKPFSCA